MPGSIKLYVNMAPELIVTPKSSVVIQLSVIAGGSNKATERPDVTTIVISSDVVRTECQRTKGSRRAR